VIDASEIEFSELIGSGGFGEVRKALWRGTDVAVKTVASGNVTNDIRNAFIDEVHLAPPSLAYTTY
jgi:serine/threonine protein kinase